MGKVTGRPTGVRLTKRQSDNCRAAIQATSLINRFQDNANGKLRDKAGNPIEMSPGQVRSAEILLNKALPNLQATELKAEVSNKTTDQLTDAELIAIASGKAAYKQALRAKRHDCLEGHPSLPVNRL